MIPLSIVYWLMGENGWTSDEAPGVVPDPIHGARFLHEIYTRAQSRYTGRVTCQRSLGQGDEYDCE
jgi:putative glutathione S-transferase